MVSYNRGFDDGVESQMITFQNVHLVVQYLVEYEPELARALMDELAIQSGFGREFNDHKDQSYLNLNEA